MTTPAATPPPRPGNQVTQVGFTGTRDHIIAQVSMFDWPEQFGPTPMVSNFVLSNLPESKDWRGTITVTAYRTERNSKGTGTAYLSTRWVPEV